MESISNPDPTYILPVLSALTTFIQSKQTMPDTGNPQNKIMLYFMPLSYRLHQLDFPGWSGSVLGNYEHYANRSAVLDGASCC